MTNRYVMYAVSGFLPCALLCGAVLRCAVLNFEGSALDAPRGLEPRGEPGGPLAQRGQQGRAPICR